MKISQNPWSRNVNSSGATNTLVLKFAGLIAFLAATSATVGTKKTSEVTRESVWGVDVEKFNQAAQLVAEPDGTIKDEGFKIIDSDLEAIMADPDQTPKIFGKYRVL